MSPKPKFFFPLSYLGIGTRILIALMPMMLLILLKPLYPPFLLKTPIVLFYPLVLLTTWLVGGLAGFFTLFSSIITIFVYIRPELISEMEADLPVLGRFLMFFLSACVFQLLVTILEHALNKAEATIRARDEFLSIISHELKTPVTAIKLQLEMLKDRYKDSAIPLNAMNPIEKMTNRQEKLVNSLLDIAMIESNQLSLRKENINLEKVILRASSSAQDSLEAGEVELDLNSVNLNCDKNKIEQAVFNIVHNAIKYGDKKTINVSLIEEDKHAIIKVKNTGPGIHLYNQNKIFQKLKRPLVPRQVQGLGVGLFLAKHFIELHDGKLEVVSHESAGTTFTVSLPLN